MYESLGDWKCLTMSSEGCGSVGCVLGCVYGGLGGGGMGGRVV